MKLILVALAYFASGRLGLAIPYVDSHITLIWLPTGIAVAALLRWGEICWPAIFLGALVTNYSLDASPVLDSCIAAGNTLAPLLAATLLRRLGFHGVLDRVYDILVLVAASAIGMLVSASIGTGSLALFNVISVNQAGETWLSWWAGDFIGVLMAAPLLLNVSRAELKRLWIQRVELLAWFSILLAISWHVFLFINVSGSHSQQLVFLLLPVVVWSAMRFGVMGSSLGVLIPALIAAVATSFGLGPFYTVDVQQGLLYLLLFFATLVLVDLMVAAMQAARNRAERMLRLDSDFNKELVQSLPGIFYMLDTSGKFLIWNRQLEDVLHCTSDEIARSHALDFFEGSDRALIAENIRKAFVVGSTAVEAVLVAKNGVKTAYYFTGRRIQHEGNPVLVGMGVVIAERRQAKNKIEAMLKRYRTLMNAAIEGVHILDMQGNVIEANQAFCNMLGYTQEEVKGLNVSAWDGRWSKDELLERIRSHVGKSERFETVHLRKDGTPVEVEVSVTGVEIEGQSCVFASSHDISERKRAEQRTEVMLRRHQVLMSSALEGIHIMDVQGNIIEANDTFCKMLGYTNVEMSGLNVADWDAQWSREELMKRFGDLIRVDGALFETKHRRKDGSIIDVEVSTTGAEIDGQLYLYASSRDITPRKKVERELRESEQKSRMLMDNAADAVFVADYRTERWVYVNDRFESLLGYSREELLAGNIYDAVTPAFRNIYRESFRSIALAGGVSTREIRLNRKDGSEVQLEMNAVTLPDGTVYGSCRDITERKRSEEGQRIAAVTFDTQEAIMITTPDAKILRVNQAFSEITGYSKDEVVGANPSIFQSGRHDAAFYRAMWSALLATGKWSGEVWDKRKDGSIYPKMMTITGVYDDNRKLTHYVAVFRDISNRKKSEQEIHQLAFYDPLTNLPNRRLLMDRLQQGLAASARNSRHGALLFLDLDHFKIVNDTQGHVMGDQLLIEVARCLQTCVREGDSVARLGGDEFVVLLENLSSEANEAASQTELVAEKIRQELNKPYVLVDFECHSTASIGISLFFNHQESADDLIQHADVAMYQAKSSGRNAVRFFDPQMQTALENRAAMEADLRHALARQQFHLCYQVQVDSLRRPLGAEVLLRWDHPERGMIDPEHFISAAEETGLIVPIGLWVLKMACAQLKAWQRDALTRELTLAVNVSAKQFRQPDFVSQAQRVLQESGAKASLLKLEFTESTVLENVEDTIAKMRELKLLGVGFSVDDFGTGYS
ncbi:MAG: PAS domain S-box protein, partial [Gallionella sp.]